MAKNPIAKALRSPHLKQQKVKNKKAYCRKDKHKNQTEGRKQSALWRFWHNNFGLDKNTNYVQIGSWNRI